MKFFVNWLSFLVSLPFRFKGGRIGKNSYIAPGYDFWFVNLRGVEIGDNCAIGRNAWIEMVGRTAKLKVGNGTNIGRNVTISCSKAISIGKKCLLSYNVSLLDHDHELFCPDISPMDSGLSVGRKIIIEDDCFIGAHSFILKGVHLGKHCIVGANSVVTKSFPAGSVVAGSPAKLIKSLREEKRFGYNHLLKSKKK